MKDVALPFNNDALSVNQILSRFHYLGPIDRGFTYRDKWGVCVFANPSSRRLPQQRWLELVRWCLYGEKNGGSQQWRAIHAWLRAERPGVTTIVSYSDPSAGHTGALYRACNWLWAPTWHRLREPPSGNGDWGNGRRQAVKDRWVFCLTKDAEREALLAVQDASIMRRMPWAEFREKHGGNFKQWRAGTVDELSHHSASSSVSAAQKVVS